MKELSIEEKAKRYEEALEKARQLCTYPTTKPFISDLQDLFPELAESEDEMTRKEIIQYIKIGTYHKDWIAWLEKQGKQDSKKVSLWKHWKDGIAGNGEDKPIYLVKTGTAYKLTSCLAFECDYIELSELDNLMFEKQNEPEDYNSIDPHFGKPIKTKAKK